MNDEPNRRCRCRAPIPLVALVLLCLTFPRPGASQDSAPQAGSFLDPDNVEARQLQRYEDATAALPRDKRGKVDWMKALRSGQIKPRADLRRDDVPMDVFKLDIIMRNTKEMPHVRFPHESHTMWLACSNCHDRIFVAKTGANPITMGKIFQGQYCGVCHDRVAFTTLFACERCHSLPHGDTQPWWTPDTGRPDRAP